MTIQTIEIEIADIDTGDRLRALDPSWVALLAEEIAHSGHFEPIRVAQRGNRYRLIDGARRLAAVGLQGLSIVEARVETAQALADDAGIRLAEIKANMLRGELTMLDRARYLSAWRDIHEAIHPAPKRGRKAAISREYALEEMSVQCGLIFSEAAKTALGLSRSSIFLLLKIATIEPAIANQIALLPTADKRGELLALADMTPTRQSAVVAMLVAEPAQATSVTEAIALLDSVPPSKPVPVYERLQSKFSVLKPAEQERFFDLNADLIERWSAKRHTSGARKSAA